MNISPISEVYNMDCVAFMREYPDKYFDLAVCDPPYGIGASNYKRGGTQHGRSLSKCKIYDAKDWDNKPPSIEYFTELFRVSKNQIIWGANHFISLMPYDSSCWIVWDKDNGDNLYADCELAWTSFDKAVRKYRFKWHGMLQENMKNKEVRMHPTQKPVKLYEWLLKNYAKEGNRILDTHLGSGSSRIAAQKLGFDFYGAEIDKDYFEASEKRFKEAVSMPLFDVPVFIPQQLVLV
jgi:site-specific DNA-methyltransferase (adenine-specific)